MPSLIAIPPAEPFAEAKARLAAAVELARAEILQLSHRIHAHPEPAFEEVQASIWIAGALTRHGFAVERPAGSLATAVRAVLRGGGGNRAPRISILAEYDALPGLGHGCGHNTMAASGVGAAIALASVAAELPGEIVFLGTPAEERGSGKQIMIDDGLFDGLDATAAGGTGPRDHSRWRDRRQHHPDRTSAWFMIRSDNTVELEAMRGRFQQLCDAAALATQTTVEVVFSGRATTMRNNIVLADRFRANMAAYGIADQGDDPIYGSTDMANVSWVCPTIHPDLAIAPEGTPGHSIRFRDAVASPQADEATLLAATLIAQTAYELFADPALVAAAWKEFRQDS